MNARCILQYLLTLGSALAAAASARAATPAPVYVTIVMHNEEGTRYDLNPSLFEIYRDRLAAFADMLAEEGAAFNFQPDWTFLVAVTNFDAGATNTAGRNILQYLALRGFTTDPHAHESVYSYADIAALIGAAGVTSSWTVGGFLAAPPGQSTYDHVAATVTGYVDTAQTWTPRVLWGGSTLGHVDDARRLWAAGIWRPAGRWNFMRHAAATSALPHIGSYGGETNRWDNLDRLLAFRAAGWLSTQHCYVVNIFLEMHEMNPTFLLDFQDRLRQYAAVDQLYWVSLEQAVQRWQTDYRSEPTLFPWNLVEDLDADGLPDAWEAFHFGDIAGQDGAADTDGDGCTEAEEYIAGTAPNDAGSRLVVAAFSNASGWAIVFPAASGRVYRVQAAAGPGQSTWRDVLTNRATADGPLEMTVPNPAAPNAAVFRLDVRAP